MQRRGPGREQHAAGVGGSAEGVAERLAGTALAVVAEEALAVAQQAPTLRVEAMAGPRATRIAAIRAAAMTNSAPSDRLALVHLVRRTIGATKPRSSCSNITPQRKMRP